MEYTEFVIEDDQGIMSRIYISDFESEQEAHIAAVQELIDWFEDNDVYDDHYSKQCARFLESIKDDIKACALDSDDWIEEAGFTIKAL